MRKIVLLTLICILPVFSVYAEDGDYSGILPVTSLYDYWHGTSGITVQNDLAYIATGNTGMAILDVSNPASPELLNNYDTPGSALSITVAENVAYISDTYSFRIVDVTDPLDPEEISVIEGFDYSLAGVENESYIYIAERTDFASELKIYDVSSLFNPIEIASLDIGPQVNDIKFSGNYAYLACLMSKLVIVDISDIENPFLAGQLNIRNMSGNIEVQGDYVYLADSYDDIFNVVDVSDPANPFITGSLDVGFNMLGFSAYGSYVFFAGHTNGLRVINVADPSTPTLIPTTVSPCLFGDVCIAENKCFAVGSSSGLKIFDITDPINSSLVGEYNIQGKILDVEVEGDLAFAAGDNAGLKIIDIYDPYEATEICEYATGGCVKELKVNDNMVYLIDSESGLKIVNVSDPENPEETASLSGVFNNIAYSNGLLAIGNDNCELLFVNVSVPENPILLSTYSLERYRSNDIKILGDKIYLTAFGLGLIVLDISNPEEPFEIVTIYCENAVGVEIINNMAFIADLLGRIYIYDISDLSEIHFADYTIEVESHCRNMFSQNNFLYLTNSQRGLMVYDVSDLENVHEVGYYDTYGSAVDVTIDEGYAYIADVGNFCIVDCAQVTNDISEQKTKLSPSEFLISEIYPNPFNPETTITLSLPINSQLKIEVFNTLGQRVKTLVNANYKAGQHLFHMTNDKMTSGIYIIVASANDKYRDVRKVVLMK